MLYIKPQNSESFFINEVNYIKISPTSGCYISATKDESKGFVANGIVFSNANQELEDKEIAEVIDQINWTDDIRTQYDSLICEQSKPNMVLKTKQDLQIFLSKNPLLWTDGKYYSVTQEKQNLLTSNIATYQIEVQTNPEAIITWNATGEECVQWDIQQLCALAVAIKDYVKPMVTYQQGLEIQINNCQSLEELNSIEINYDQFKQSN